MSAGRKPKLNFTECLGQWTTCIRGVRHRLGKDEKAAKETFEWLLIQDGQAEVQKEANPLLGDLFAAWQRHITSEGFHPSRLRLCKERLREFLKRMGLGARLSDLHPAHVDAWINAKHSKADKTKPVAKGTQRQYASLLLACLNWCAKPVNLGGGELIPSNPLKGRVKLQRGGSRGEEAVWLPETFEQVCKVGHPNFVDAVKFLAWTGIRPSLLTRLEACHYNKDQKRFDVDAITHRRKKLKYIRLPDEAIAPVDKLVAKHPTGKLFRNAWGDPWKSDAMQIYLFEMIHKRIKTKDLKWQKGITIKGLRHSFATAFLRKHPDKIEYLRIILGHSDYKMIFKHYGKLVGQHQAIAETMSTFSAF